MYYTFKQHHISHPSEFHGDSFRDGENWYKVFRDEDSFSREKGILKDASTCRGVVKMIDSGMIEKVNENGSVENYFAIKEKYISGETFVEYASVHHCETTGIHFFCQLATTLYELEKKSIIHNDIKPENIAVDENGNPCVIDLNIAKIEGESVSEIHTRISPGFAAPEKNRGEITVQSDIFSFGRLIKYYMDKNPDRGAAAYSVDFNAVRIKCSADNPLLRYHSFADVLNELSEILVEKKIPETRKEDIIKEWFKSIELLPNAKKLITILLLIVSIFFLFLGTYMILRPSDKEPIRTHASNPSLREDCAIVITDIKNLNKHQ